VERVPGPTSGAHDRVPRDRGPAHPVSWGQVLGGSRSRVPVHPRVHGDLGAAEPLRGKPGRVQGRRRRHPPRIHGLFGRRRRGALHDPRRRPHLARRRADSGVVRGADEPRRRRHAPNLGVLSSSSLARYVQAGT
jgi:hypothetical protein